MNGKRCRIVQLSCVDFVFPELPAVVPSANWSIDSCDFRKTVVSAIKQPTTPKMLIILSTKLTQRPSQSTWRQIHITDTCRSRRRAPFVDADAKWPPLGGRKWIDLFPTWPRGAFWGEPASETPTILTVSMSISSPVFTASTVVEPPAVRVPRSHHLFVRICSYLGLRPIIVWRVVSHRTGDERSVCRRERRGSVRGSVSRIESSCDLRLGVREWPAMMLAMPPTRGTFDAGVAMSHRCCRMGPYRRVKF